MDYLKEITAAVTICDKQGIIVYMNNRSADIFQGDGGRGLIGSNLFDCHPEPARAKLKDLLDNGKTNVYTIEKNGQKKIIYQSPCNGGMVEISFEIPNSMDHFIRS